MCNYKCTPVLNITHHNNVHFEYCVMLYCRLFSVYPLSNHIPIMGSIQCSNVSAFCVGNKRYCAIIVLHLTIIPHVPYFCLSVILSVYLTFDFQENPSHGELQTRPMCCPEPDDVPFIFECVLMWSTYRIQ